MHELVTISHEWKSCQSMKILSPYPSPLNYVGFPKSLWSSINAVSTYHGIPDTWPLLLVDILSFDVSCFLVHGVDGDNCAKIIVLGDSQETTMSNRGVDWKGVLYCTQCELHNKQSLAFWNAQWLVHVTPESMYAVIAAYVDQDHVCLKWERRFKMWQMHMNIIQWRNIQGMELDKNCIVCRLSR